MKKYLAILISIISLLFCLITYLIMKEESQTLKGEEVNSFLYAYKLKETDETIAGITPENNKIYFLIERKEEKENYYELYERDIFSDKNKILKEFKKENTNCNLISDYIQCTDSNKITLYDFNLKKRYQASVTNSEDFPKIVPYKDTFIKIENKKLYILQNEKEQMVQELPESLKDSFVENYYVTKENTYLLLYNINEEKYYIYDINKKKYDIIESKNSYTYKNGFYFYDKNKYIVTNKEKKYKKEYSNIYQFDFHYPSMLCDDNETLYLYNITENKIQIINLEKNTIIRIGIAQEEQITEFYTLGKYMLVKGSPESNQVYLIDRDKIEKNAVKIPEEIKQKDQILNEKIIEIKEKYNVIMKVKSDANINFPDFKAEVEKNNDVILEALPKITSILEKYSKEVFNSFYDNINNGLNIYLTSSLTPTNTENQISNPAAYSLNYKNEYMIVIDISEPNIEELLCHELLHNIEMVLTRDTEIPFKDWKKYNPKDFKYNISYTKPYKFNYTLNEQKKENVYFIDEYSHTYATEDRARIFENICACKNTSVITGYPNLLKKGKYIEEELYKYYPTLQDTSLFDSIQ